MPVYPCKWPTCTDYVRRRGDYCGAHAEHQQADRQQRDRYYDQHKRDPDAKRFYDSKAWKAARAKKLHDEPVCEECGQKLAEHVHHKKPLADCTTAERVDQTNLESVCQPCHNKIEKSRCSSK